ncbi:hypothetical protein [Nocardioides sp. AX2bis]|uniref:hypothetical protein n=1 Tax=Nocardioides sp. AX2bis TaxID=2653157 RepID=UPI0012F18510|nr:hypothetical protein [Nocardioides sp. AX2bis]VXB68401.1 exported hypothetical protein [Nocardioides sp. AX2bis]
MSRHSRAAALGLAIATTFTVTVTPAVGLGLPGPYQDADEYGDVVITEKRGLPTPQRRSIDLGDVRVLQDEPNRQVELVVQMRKVTDSKKFDQVVTIAFGSDTVGGAVELSPSPSDRRSGTAGWFEDGGELKRCRGLVTEILDTRVSRTTVPYRCIPDTPVSVSVLVTTEPDRRGLPWSADQLRSDGTYQLRPAAQ